MTFSDYLTQADCLRWLKILDKKGEQKYPELFYAMDKLKLRLVEPVLIGEVTLDFYNFTFCSHHSDHWNECYFKQHYRFEDIFKGRGVFK